MNELDSIALADSFRNFLWGYAFKFLLTIFFVNLIPRVLFTVFRGLD